ncbi:MAG: hypothetical protein ABEJ93_03815 [Candidatus Nanohalobium sp.]
MFPVRIDPMGILDLLSGLLLMFTASPVPESISQVHAAFLIFKGLATIIRPLPVGGMPVYVLGGAADTLSAAILFLGQPPILAAYKTYIAGLLFLKGVWTTFSIMNL